MERTQGKQQSVFRTIDWFTVGLYLLLLLFGWLSVCGASYDYGQPDFFDWATRSGKQLIWIGCSLALALVILLLDDKIYDTFANIIYLAFMALLLVTPFLASDIKGSYSWIKLGSISLQPAEFAKCATALAVAKYMGAYGFNIHHWRDFFVSMGLVLLPMLLIIMQRETGSALVYSAFFLMMYREGMSGSILFAGIATIVFFVVGVRFSDTLLPHTLVPIGQFAVMTLIWMCCAGLIYVYCREKRYAGTIFLCGIAVTTASYIVSAYIYTFNIGWVLLAFVIGITLYLLYLAFSYRRLKYLYIALFSAGSLLFFHSTDFVMNKVLEPHQQTRVKVLLGIENDPSGVGYNVNQSKIAIGSGGLQGKGFLNGTQTKLKYVPEQTTDFIFCTVGEEEGFLGAAGTLLLFLILILRLIYLAERQSYAFGRIYGYSVLSIFLFHLFINVGMVIGLTPVIGIPLPFFSYGGSSLWGFTLLLFIFLRIDAARGRKE